MNIIRRNADRRHIRSGPGEMWLTFYPREPAGTLDEGFGMFSLLNESILSADKAVASNLERESELITYVHKGALALLGPMEYAGLITAGEFQSMMIGRIPGQRGTNTSTVEPAHFFRLFFRVHPAYPGSDYTEAQVRFTAAQRRNVLCAVASPDARNASLRITTDAHVYSSILDPGRHITHELALGRKAWLHIVYGRVSVNDSELTRGDGMGIADERSISLTAQESAELLLVDTGSDFNRARQGAADNEAGKQDTYSQE